MTTKHQALSPRVDVSSELIDDYFPAKPVDPISGACVSVRLAGQAAVTVLFAEPDKLVELRPDGGSHGLRRAEYPLPGITELSAIATTQGLLAVAVATSSNGESVAHILERDANGDLWEVTDVPEWGRDWDKSVSHAIGRNAPDGGVVVAHTNDVGGYSLHCRPPGGDWIACNPDGPLGVSALIDVTFVDNDGTTFLLLTSALEGQQVFAWAWPYSNILTRESGPGHMMTPQGWGYADFTKGQSAAVPGTESSILRSTDGNLWRLQGTHMVELGIAPPLASFELAQDSAGRVHLFGIAQADNQLGVSRDLDIDSGTSSTWQPLAVFAERLIGVACDDVTEVVVQEVDGNLLRMTQTSRATASGSLAGKPSPWRASVYKIEITDRDEQRNDLRSGTCDTKDLPHSVYAYEISIADQSGRAVPGCEVSVSSDRPVMVVNDDVGYHISHTLAAPLIADPTGKLELRALADGLAAPVLTFTVTGVDTPTNAAADSQAHQRLATTTADTLKACPLVAGQDTTAVAASLSQSGHTLCNLAAKRDGTPPPADAKVQPQRFTCKSDPSGHLNITIEPAPSRTVGPDEALNLLDDFFNDVVWFFTRTAEKIEQLVVTIYDDAVELLIEGEKFVVSTVEDAAQAIELLLAKIAAAVMNAVDAVESWVAWLRALFNWQDIVNTANTMRAMVGCMGRAIPDLATFLQETFPDSAKTKPARLAEAYGGQTIGRAAPASPAGGPLAQDMRQPVAKQSVRSAYASRRTGADAATAVTKTSQLTMTAEEDNPFTPFEELGSADNLQRWKDNITSHLKPIDTSNGADGLLDTLLDDALGIIDGIIEDVAEASIDLVGGLFRTCSDDMTSTGGFGDTPVDNVLLEWLLGDSCTLLDLAFLLAAAPATIIYKLANDDAAPFTASSADEWTHRDLSPNAHPTAAVGALLADDELIKYLWIGFGARTVALIADAALDGMAILIPDPAPETPRPTPEIIADVVLSLTLAVASVTACTASMASMRTNSAWSPADNPGDAAMLAAWCGGALPAVASWLGSLATIGKGIDPNSRSSLRFKAPGPPVYAVLGAIGLGISGLAWAIGSGKEMGDGEKFGLKQGLPLLFDPLTCLDKLGVFFARGKGPTPAGIAAAAIVIIIDAVGWITPVGIDLGEAYHHEPAIDQSNKPRSTDHVVTRAGDDSGR